MTTAEDFVLVMTDPVTGKHLVGSTVSDAVMGGAFLIDLVEAGRLALDGEGREARVVAADHAHTGDALLDGAFDRVRQRGRQRPQSIVTRLGRKGRDRTYRALASRGAVQPRHEKAFGLFPLTRHDVLDTARRDDLLTRIRAVLLHDQPADAETGPIIGLLSAASLTKAVVDKPDRRRAKARAKVVSEGDWASEGVRKAIQAAQSAVTAGVVAATVATAGGS